MTDVLERVFESEAFLTLKHYPRLTASLLVLLATLAVAMLRVPS